jgi:hypothetical protein
VLIAYTIYQALQFPTKRRLPAIRYAGQLRKGCVEIIR